MASEKTTKGVSMLLKARVWQACDKGGPVKKGPKWQRTTYKLWQLEWQSLCQMIAETQLTVCILMPLHSYNNTSVSV